MAYTIISQNNTTTTLSDENGNVITVPARVTLATSTDYTIIKVNNNSVDLESGDGKIIRGVPACVVLAGEGGGGGGSVDYSKTVQKTSSMPVASADNAGQVFLYTGTTDANYTQNYIYKNVKTATYTGEIFFAMAVTTSVDCSVSNFANFIVSEGGADPTLVTRGGLTYKGDNLWELVARDSNGDLLCTIREYTEDFEDAGFVFTGTPVVDDSMSFDCTITEASATYTWTRIDVQPAGATYTAGNGIGIDANNEISVTDPVLVNKATGTSSLALLGSAAGGFSVAVGDSASCSSSSGTAVGYNAKTTAVRAIQLGGATNSDANTFKVGNANGNYEIMSADGTIPTDRFTTTPSADGTYVPTLTISSGVATRTWGSGGGGGGSYTAGTGIDITNDVISTKIPMVTVTTDSTTPTVTAKAGGTGLIAIGQGAQAGSANYGDNCVVIGEGARATGTFSGYNAVAIGGGSYAGGDGVAIGASTHSGNLGGVAIGYGVRAGNGGIIIGSDTSASTTGTNTGFDIVLYDPATFTSTMYNVIKKGGEINPDRLGTGYDASKTQTLKNVQGVLTWVDD